MAYGKFATCDNSACGKQVPDAEIDNWLAVQTQLSPAQFQAMNQKVLNDIQNLMLMGAPQYDAERTVRDEMVKDRFAGDFCSIHCLIVAASDFQNTTDLDAELSTGVTFVVDLPPPAEPPSDFVGPDPEPDAPTNAAEFLNFVQQNYKKRPGDGTEGANA